MTIIAIATRQLLPDIPVRVVARWLRADNTGIAIGHWHNPANEKPFYSWAMDRTGAVIVGSTQDHWTEREALDRILAAIGDA